MPKQVRRSIFLLALHHQTQRHNLELQLARRLIRMIQMSSLDLRKSLLRRKLYSVCTQVIQHQLLVVLVEFQESLL